MGLMPFTLPDLGEGLEEAEIVAWHVGPGDRVVADQPLVSVETDKAVVEIPAPWAGTLVEILAEPGATVRVGAPLATFETEARPDAGAVVGELATARVEAAPPASGPATPGAVRAAPAARALAARHGIDLAALAGSGPGARSRGPTWRRGSPPPRRRAAGSRSARRGGRWRGGWRRPRPSCRRLCRISRTSPRGSAPRPTCCCG
jgi:pyruvate/2-oxoglutarate dehydrogenase complex dihydrolipoamide acyltransferase (E2) component